MPDILMKCGCRASATDAFGKPVCVTHLGLNPDAAVVAEAPNLEGRKAKCTYCNSRSNSALDIPFFVYQPNKSEDAFYCGCRGWD